MRIPRKSKAQQEKIRQAKASLDEHQSAFDPIDESPPKRRTMKQWQSFVDEQIQNAMSNGRFDNLPGKGKPLNLNKNPYDDPAQELTNHVLKNNNFTPEWIDRDRDIRQDLDAAREKIQAAWRFYQPDPESEPGWYAAVARFEEAVVKINRKIDDFNLVVPILSKQRFRIRPADELRRVQEASQINSDTQS